MAAVLLLLLGAAVTLVPLMAPLELEERDEEELVDELAVEFPLVTVEGGAVRAEGEDVAEVEEEEKLVAEPFEGKAEDEKDVAAEVEVEPVAEDEAVAPL